jgi:hypothetical protein
MLPKRILHRPENGERRGLLNQIASTRSSEMALNEHVRRLVKY